MTSGARPRPYLVEQAADRARATAKPWPGPAGVPRPRHADEAEYQRLLAEERRASAATRLSDAAPR